MICGQAGLLDRVERARHLSQQWFALLNPPEWGRLEPDMGIYSAVLTEQMVRKMMPPSQLGHSRHPS